MTIQEFLQAQEELKFLKWIEVIQQENLAVKLESMYILERDKISCDVIFIDGRGNKRKLESITQEKLLQQFPLIDLSNLTAEDKLYWQSFFGINTQLYNDDFD